MSITAHVPDEHVTLVSKEVSDVDGDISGWIDIRVTVSCVELAVNIERLLLLVEYLVGAILRELITLVNITTVACKKNINKNIQTHALMYNR